MVSSIRPGPLTMSGRAVLFIALLGTGLTGCSSYVGLPVTQVPPDSAILTLNGEPLSLEDFDNDLRLMAIHYSAVSEETMRRMKRRLTEQVIDRRLIYQEARKKGIRITRREFESALKEVSRDSPDDFPVLLKKQGVAVEVWKRGILLQLYVQKLAEQEVYRKVEITPDEVEEFYWAHLTDAWLADSVKARHLVVRTLPEMVKAKKRLAMGEAFEKVSAELSVGPQRLEGGDWGWMSLADLSPVYIRAMKDLKPGQVSSVVRDGFGYHLFQFLESRPRQIQSLKAVRNRIHDALLKEEQDNRFDQWLTGLKEKAVIQVNQEMAPLMGEIPEATRVKKK